MALDMIPNLEALSTIPGTLSIEGDVFQIAIEKTSFRNTDPAKVRAYIRDAAWAYTYQRAALEIHVSADERIAALMLGNLANVKVVVK